MIEITKIELKDVLTNGDLNSSLLLEKINTKLKNLDSNINEVNIKYAGLREAFVQLKMDISKDINDIVSNRIDELIEEYFDNEEE